MSDVGIVSRGQLHRYGQIYYNYGQAYRLLQSVSWRRTEWLRYASERLRSMRHLTDPKNGRQTTVGRPRVEVVDLMRGVIWS